MKTKTSDLNTIEAEAEAEEAGEEANSEEGETITEGEGEIIRTDPESLETHPKRK